MKCLSFIIIWIAFCLLAPAQHAAAKGVITRTDTTGQTVADSSINKALDGTWQLQQMSKTSATNAVAPTLSLNTTTATVTGTTGCNNLSGTFTLQGNNLVFGEQIIVTKKACPGYNEKAFLQNLTQTNRYTLHNGILELRNNNTVLSRWTKSSSVKDSTNKI